MLPADTVLLNANVITVDPYRPRAEAVAIRDGKFAAVGSTAQIRSLAGPQTQVLDLSGKTVVPGFIDAHLHVLSSGVAHVLAVDCDLPSIGEIQQTLQQRADKTPKGQWVRGFKFDDTKTREGRFPSKEELDAVSSDHPVFVTHRGGHSFCANSRAFQRLGVDRGTPDPPGGKFERHPATGQLTGVLHERAGEAFGNAMPTPSPADHREGLRLICRMFNAAGLTSVHDAIVHRSDLEVYRAGLAAKELTLRVYALIWHDCFDHFQKTGLGTGFGDEMLRLGGIKMMADGAIAGRTAWLSEAYAGSADDYGIRVIEPRELEEKTLEIHRAGFQVCVHANGDAAIDMVLAAYEKAVAAHPRPDPRHRIEHCTLVTPSILQRMAKLGCIATPFCTYVYHHGEKMKYYGEERLERMFAQRSFLDHGIVSTGSTDYVPGPYEPLLGIQSCVTRTDSTGKVWGASQKITVEEALRMYTYNGAYASFEEDVKGSIAAGKLADLVVLGADPTAVDPHEIKDIPVERTVVGGETVYQI